MKKISFFIWALVCLATSCNEHRFIVDGEIKNAKDSVLYFENIGLEEITCLDSVVLDADGNFSFSEPTVDAPEFYRLRIADQIISLSIDSNEVVSIKGTYPEMATNYTVEGSDNCTRIKELTLRQMDLRKRIEKVIADETLSSAAEDDSIMGIISNYKAAVCKDYIFKDPSCASSYFALFQTIGSMLIFNPSSDKSDVRVFAAVATSWDTFHPNATRGVNLHNIAIEGMNNTRVPKRDTLSIDPAKVEEAGIIDIALPDKQGATRRLTELKGKVVLLHFNVFNTENSPAIIMQLRDLYNQYHSKGLEIYQVSFDENEHFWKTTTAKLPWICVRDANCEASQYIPLYNIQSIPAYYLIDRTNTLRFRDSQIKDLPATIAELL
ncbi:MAG: AhpC/TSA family protein [Bacteroidales bacterium]|nr:AhpC/TSA family protein [Bacteroidales bacterium]